MVTVERSSPGSSARSVFVYAPGAGSNINDLFGAYCSSRLPGESVETWRFQFPYMEAAKRGPDRPPTLEATWRAVLREAQKPGLPVIAGGRSMGGRIASQVVAHGVEVAALALFAYPLHPPGRPDQRRDAHLPSVNVPTLFCSGTRDAFATPDELAAAAALVPRSTVHLLDGSDHGFDCLKSSGRTRADVWKDAVDALLSFLASEVATWQQR